MRKLLFISGLFFLFVNQAFAGSLDQSSAPTVDSTRMYTLEQIYQKVTSGTIPTKQSGGFNEPLTGPTAGTMHTLDAIEAKIAAGTTTAAAGDVLASKTFITRTAGSGESAVTGAITTQTLSAANDTVAAGYYAATTLSAVDTDLAVGNIKSGVTIFGFPGTYAGGSYGIPKTGANPSSYGGYTPVAGEDMGTIGTPASGNRFANTADTTNSVTDNGTGLIWIKSHAVIGTVGGYNFANGMSWSNALLAVTALNSANYDGSNQWRLPNVKELQSIVDYGRVNPSIDTSFFTSQSYYYWSSTTYAAATDDAWDVSFYSGGVYYDYKDGDCYVRPVRGGQ